MALFDDLVQCEVTIDLALGGTSRVRASQTRARAVPDRIDALFQTAVAAIDAGDIAALERVLANDPALVGERLHSPGPWLKDQAWIARECDVQIALIDVLVDPGASTEGTPDNALVNGNSAAADHLLTRGATLTLAAALGLHRWEDAQRLAQEATPRERQAAFILAALHGNAAGLRIMIDNGAEINAPSPDLYSHASALHHAVWSGSLDAVKTLVEAGQCQCERHRGGRHAARLGGIRGEPIFARSSCAICGGCNISPRAFAVSQALAIRIGESRNSFLIRIGRKTARNATECHSGSGRLDA